MKKITIKFILILVLGMSYSNVMALSLFDFKACELHGIEYTLVRNHEQCPLVDWHEDLVAAMSSVNNKTDSNNSVQESTVGAFIRSKHRPVVFQEEMNSEDMSYIQEDSKISYLIELYEVIVHGSHCYSSHPGHI